MPDNTASSKGLTLTFEESKGIPVIRCSGRVVAGFTDRLYGEVRALLPNNKRIILDFTEVHHIDSMGLGMLARIYVSSKSAGCVVDIVNMGKSVRSLLGITHMLSMFQMIGENGIRMG
jgi:anti-sigma B factor antagonist